MDTIGVYKILNLYNFVKTEKEKTDKSYISERLWEYSLLSKQRSAVAFCKKLNAINFNDLTKLNNEDKESLESCLRENFLSRDPDYFGKRDVIYLDLHNYDI